MERKANARWKGDLKNGKGTLSTESGVLKDTSYAFSSRFENGSGTNPEELIGAALAGCYSMALSAALANAGHKPEDVRTDARVMLEKVDEKMTITKIQLDTQGRVPGLDSDTFNDFAEKTRESCIISRALTADISVQAKLLQEA